MGSWEPTCCIAMGLRSISGDAVFCTVRRPVAATGRLTVPRAAPCCMLVAPTATPLALVFGT
jgi:hypothetical protein